MENRVTVKRKRILCFAVFAAALVCCALLIFVIGAAGRTAGSLADQLELGQKYLDELDYEQALVAFEAALNIDPRSQEAYLGLAETYAAMGDLDRAAATLEEGYEKTGSEELARRLADLKERLQAERTGGTDSGNDGTSDEAGSQARAENSGGDTDSGNQGTWAPMPEDHVMDWKDANLEAAMREITNGIVEGDMMLSDVWEITELDLGGYDIRDISALSELTNLEKLSLCYNLISDVSSLASLTKLTSLSLDTNQISDIAPLAALTNLTWLDLDDNQINDVSPLAALTDLTGIQLNSNQISDVTSLSGLINLEQLDLGINQINDITSLAALTKLTYLDLGENQLSEISNLAALINLTELRLNNNSIRDISSLAALTNLKTLYLQDNPIGDLSPVSFVETVLD